MLKWLSHRLQYRVINFYINRGRRRLTKRSRNPKNHDELLRCFNDVIEAYRWWRFVNPDYAGGARYSIYTRCLTASDAVYWSPQRQFRRIPLTKWLQNAMTPERVQGYLLLIHESVTAANQPSFDHRSVKPNSRLFHSRMGNDFERVQVEIPLLLEQLLSILAEQLEREHTQRLLWQIH